MGYKLRVQEQPTPAIVHWVDAQEYVEWPRAVKHKGTYRVEVTYACAPEAGGEFMVKAGAAKSTGHAENTGNWQSWRTVELEPIRIINDNTTVSLRAVNGIERALMHVRQVKMTPEAEGH